MKGDLKVRTTGVPGGPLTAALSCSVDAPAMLQRVGEGLGWGVVKRLGDVVGGLRLCC